MKWRNKVGIQNQVRKTEFCGLLKHWRNHRSLSQLDLALRADVSQRHVSWLETGRSQPSRDMVLRLTEALDIPLRERNQLLTSAGFAAMFTENKLDEPSMKPVLHVISRMLDNHEPFPAIVLDRMWNIIMQNKAAGILFQITGDPASLWQAVGDNGDKNIALLSIHPNGLRQFISNWATAGPMFLRRLKREALESGDQRVIKKFYELETLAGETLRDDTPDDPLLPILPLEFQFGDFKLSLFTVISTFGTAQDVTTDELRIETFYPTDDQSAAFFQSHH